jgi:hypothetical protein
MGTKFILCKVGTEPWSLTSEFNIDKLHFGPAISPASHRGGTDSIPVQAYEFCSGHKGTGAGFFFRVLRATLHLCLILSSTRYSYEREKRVKPGNPPKRNFLSEIWDKNTRTYYKRSMFWKDWQLNIHRLASKLQFCKTRFSVFVIHWQLCYFVILCLRVTDKGLLKIQDSFSTPNIRRLATMTKVLPTADVKASSLWTSRLLYPLTVENTTAVGAFELL